MTEQTLQEQLRSADMFNPTDEDLQNKAADAIDTLRAEVARLREALMLITGAYDPKDYGGNSEVMFSIAGAALQSHREAGQ
jgi:hypothetical protein